MKDEDLRSALEYELQQSVLWSSDGVREEQLRNLQYYLGLPRGDEVDGRSQVVSWDVFEIVESAMPSFIEPFFASDSIAEFAPRTPQDEAFASQATDYVNFIVKDDNPGFMLFNTWLKDALISKIGILRADWIEQDDERVSFEGLSDEQFTMLTQQPGVEIIEHEAEPAPMPGMAELNAAQMIQQFPTGVPMLHNVTALRKRDGKVEIEAVRPELFVITKGCATPEKARLIGEVCTYTRGELHEQGFSQAYTVDSFDAGSLWQSDEHQAMREGEYRANLFEDANDESQQEVRLFRGFMRADFNGDKIAEWRRVLVGSGEKPFLENEECEYQNYCVITPIPLPHRVIGMAYADAAAQIQDINTSLTRQYLNGLYLANHPRTYVNIAAGVNMADLLNQRIGGIVRGTRPPGEAIAPLVTSVVPGAALEGLEMGQMMRERRLGITRYNQGLDADTLNKTAAGQKMIQTAGDKRQAMTLRIIAETGVRDLFRLVLRLVCQYQDRARTARLRGGWVEFDPRQWSPDMDVTVDVGVGTGDRTETVVALQQFGTYMAAAETKGLVGRDQWYEFGLMMAKAMRLKGADQKLILSPKDAPPMQPPPDPNAAKAQADMQMLSLKLEHAGQQMEMRMRADSEKINAQMMAKLQETRAQLELQSSNDARDSQREIMKAEMDAVLERRDQDLKKYLGELDAQVRLLIAGQRAEAPQEGPQSDA